MVNIRLRAPAGERVTKQRLGEVIDSIRDGEVPSGWAFSGIEWMNPKRSSSGWKRGTLDDLEKFLPMLRKISKDKLVAGFRAAEVERFEEESRGRTRREVELQARADRWHRARAKEVRAIERLKSKEARDRHRKKAETYRQRYEKAVSALERIAFPEGREFELAADYEPRSRGKR